MVTSYRDPEDPQEPLDTDEKGRRISMRVLAVLIIGSLALVPMRLCYASAESSASAQDDGITVHGVAGTVVSLVTGARPGETVKPTPFIDIAVDAPVAESPKAPHLMVNLALTNLPGQSIRLRDTSTWKALEATVGIAQPITEKIKFDLMAEAGFATRLDGDEQPRYRTARWVAGGVRFRSSRGALAVKIGADQRMSGVYEPAVGLTGSLVLYERQAGTLRKSKVVLVGDAVLGLMERAYTTQAGRSVSSHDVVRVGLAIGL